jgi:hypothetical protein
LAVSTGQICLKRITLKLPKTPKAFTVKELSAAIVLPYILAQYLLFISIISAENSLSVLSAENR